MYESEELKLFQELLLKLGVTLTLAVVLFGVYFFMARKRAKKVPPSVFAIFISTLVLYILLVLNESDLIEFVDLWPEPYRWLKFVAYLGTAYFLLKAMDLLFLEDYLVVKKGLYVPDLMRMLIVITGLAVAVLISLRLVMGINVVALVAIPTAATAVIGFALQDTLKRFFAGLMLGKLVRVGHWVCLAGKEGRVVKVDLGHVTIHTQDDDLVMIPNNLVAQQEILNYNKPTTKHARTACVEAAYDVSPMTVEAVLVEAAKAVPDVLHDPSPQAFVQAYKDSSILYRLKFWINDYAKAQDTEGRVLSYVWYAFKRHGIEIPFPQRTIHVTKAEDAAQRSAKELDRLLEALRKIDFLSVLAPEEMSKVADEAKTQIYLPGEAVVHQGEPGTEFFFIVEGEAEVRVGADGHTEVVATLHALQFFGEMSLLTGESRSATVVARTRLEVLMLGKKTLARPILENPLLAERMGDVLAQRKTNLAEQHDRLQQRGHPSRESRAEARSLGTRIKGFFGVAAG